MLQKFLYETQISSKINNLTFKNNDVDKDKEDMEDEEYKLIKEYLNYKNFKKILSLVKSES